MPIEVGIWRVDGGLKTLSFKEIEQEAALQEFISNDISVVDARLMVIGREVTSQYSGRIDVLAIDGDGNLAVIELKRNRTPSRLLKNGFTGLEWLV